MASKPQALVGAVAGRKSRGTASVTFAEGGKVMSLLRETVVLMGVVALQSREAAAAAVAAVALGGGAGALHAPAALAGVVVPLPPQHLQAPQPAENCVKTAAALQQQPPRHRLEAQSKCPPQASPGMRATQVPLPRAQAPHPACTAVGLQHTPPRQVPDAQLLLLLPLPPPPPVQGVPAGSSSAPPAPPGRAAAVQAAALTAPISSVPVPAGHAEHAVAP
jgi:hypothetical protein